MLDQNDPVLPAPLVPSGLAAQQNVDDMPTIQPPAGGIAYRLSQTLTRSGSDLIYLSTSEQRSDEIARALASFAPEAQVLHLRPWDCLPYDRARPSSESMGRRLASLKRMLETSPGPRIVVTSPEAVVQKLPPRSVIKTTALTLKRGAVLDRQGFEHFVLRAGYVIDDRVDEPGEVALRGNVVEVFPADADTPIRITDDENGLITTITRYDPRSQRSLEEVDILQLGPASELISDEPSSAAADEHRLADHYGQLETLFDYLPRAQMIASDLVIERIANLHEQIAEAYQTACEFSETGNPQLVQDLYLDAKTWAAALAKTKRVDLDIDELEASGNFSTMRRPGLALKQFVDEQGELGRSVIICGLPTEQRQLQKLLRRQSLEAHDLEGPLDAVGKTSQVLLAPYDLDKGFIDARARIAVVAAADVLGSRLNETQPALQLAAPVELRVGDVVVHEDHGVGVLRDLTKIETNGVVQDTIRLQYHGDASILVPIEDFSKLWRYGADPDAVVLDRLNTDAWLKKRGKVSAEIDEAAVRLAELAQARLKTRAPVLRPPKTSYQRLVARFSYAETPDQAAAIADVLDDLGSGRQMNRLVCGDVGFGKTEVALRAAAAAALAGKQVAVVAPTTVLARQHLQSFERRFSGTQIAIGQLSRLNSAAENKEVKAKLASGAIHIVVGTHAIVADDVDIPDLGLVIVDEEQRFGAKIKRKLEALADGVHMLFMSATPIPRTMQAAMVGVQDASIIATPPARRRPIRTFVVPYDAASARTALLREKRRSGQSFVVVPRIEDIAVVTEELNRLVPELAVVTAHGELAASEIDEALLGFANGRGDILLATNIIESGLDVPRANTMLIWRADRFGLSQLHQLRGRVGRGRAQGVAYLFMAPNEDASEATLARLSTLQTFDRLGAGFEISARDMELRGAGDLLGEDQAGHVHLIGASLYQQILEQAMRRAKGEDSVTLHTARLNVGAAGTIPDEYVPEAVLRINLYARLQRLARVEDIDDFADELEDRFGERPAEVDMLLDLARFGVKAAALGVVQIDAGPLAIALTATDARIRQQLGAATERLEIAGDRLICKLADGADPLAELSALLDELSTQ